MTALVYAIQPDQICIAMDTLVVAADDRLPVAFQRKFLSMPESDVLVAGTGHAGFINGWFGYVQSLTSARGLDDLDSVAPRVLAASANAAGGLGSTTATLYHFGYSAAECRYGGYAYRSTSGFCSERLPYALGFKPVVPVASTDDVRFPEFMVDIVQRQQQFDRSLPICEQVGVGGEIEFAVLANHTIRIQTVHRFDSYDAERRHIASRSEA
jgi:hypothetical protein